MGDLADYPRIVDQQAAPRVPGLRLGRRGLRRRDRLLGFRAQRSPRVDGRRALQALDQALDGCGSLWLRTWLAAITTA